MAVQLATGGNGIAGSAFDPAPSAGAEVDGAGRTSAAAKTASFSFMTLDPAAPTASLSVMAAIAVNREAAAIAVNSPLLLRQLLGTPRLAERLLGHLKVNDVAGQGFGSVDPSTHTIMDAEEEGALAKLAEGNSEGNSFEAQVRARGTTGKEGLTSEECMIEVLPGVRRMQQQSREQGRDVLLCSLFCGCCCFLKHSFHLLRPL